MKVELYEKNGAGLITRVGKLERIFAERLGATHLQAVAGFHRSSTYLLLEHAAGSLQLLSSYGDFWSLTFLVCAEHPGYFPQEGPAGMACSESMCSTVRPRDEFLIHEFGGEQWREEGADAHTQERLCSLLQERGEEPLTAVVYASELTAAVHAAIGATREAFGFY